MNSYGIFAWGFAAGWVAAQALFILRVWRHAKRKVNEARRQYGLEAQKRWWRL